MSRRRRRRRKIIVVIINTITLINATLALR